MPTNRVPISRPRRAQIAEALALFVELETTPQPPPRFGDRSCQLAEQLNLVDEWIACQSVLDRSETPCYPPEMGAYAMWHRCREVREQLLAAAEERGLATDNVRALKRNAPEMGTGAKW
jgi:hypothetical protein